MFPVPIETVNAGIRQRWPWKPRKFAVIDVLYVGSPWEQSDRIFSFRRMLKKEPFFVEGIRLAKPTPVQQRFEISVLLPVDDFEVDMAKMALLPRRAAKSPLVGWRIHTYRPWPIPRSYRIASSTQTH